MKNNGKGVMEVCLRMHGCVHQLRVLIIGSELRGDKMHKTNRNINTSVRLS